MLDVTDNPIPNDIPDPEDLSIIAQMTSFHLPPEELQEVFDG
jgi:hypothetical protein